MVARIKHMARFMDKEKIAEVFKLPTNVIQDVLDGQVTGSEAKIEGKPSHTQVIERVRYVKNRTITVIGSGGGVGKTTLLASLAVNSTIQTQSPIALVDFSESANLAHHLEMGLFAQERISNPMPSFWPHTAPSKEQVYQQLLVAYPELNNLFILPGLSTLDSYKCLDSKYCCTVLGDLEGYFEAIFVDIPSSLQDAEDILKNVDLILIIVNCDYVSIAGLPHLYHSLESLGLTERTMVIINKAGQNGNLSKDETLELLKEAVPDIYIEAFLPFDSKMVNANKVEYCLGKATLYTEKTKELLEKINPDWRPNSQSEKGIGSLLKRLAGI